MDLGLSEDRIQRLLRLSIEASERERQRWAIGVPLPTLPAKVEVRKGLEGNLCRCTGYEKIIHAVELASNDIGSARK